MSLNTIAADDAAFLLEELGEDVVHRPRGNPDNDTTQTGVWEPDRDSLESEAGRSEQSRGSLTVSSALVLQETDRWRIGGKWFETESIDVPQAGLVRIAVVASERFTRRRS